ncbi:MAG: hypothetical protein NTU84_00020 [Verrucomicrobia bacterium]|nr:hypothetical protein [Verrucomicrobiota bacterium]
MLHKNNIVQYAIAKTKNNWEMNCEKGEKGEDIIQSRFLSANWSVLPTGLTDPDRPPPRLHTPTGIVRPCDFVAFHPDGRRMYIIEAKYKSEMTSFRGYGLDKKDTEDDHWHQLQLHDKLAGPILLVIHDWIFNQEVAATIPMLRANGGPTISNSGKYWMWKSSVFCPLDFFLNI